MFAREAGPSYKRLTSGPSFDLISYQRLKGCHKGLQPESRSTCHGLIPGRDQGILALWKPRGERRLVQVLLQQIPLLNSTRPAQQVARDLSGESMKRR